MQKLTPYQIMRTSDWTHIYHSSDMKIKIDREKPSFWPVGPSATQHPYMSCNKMYCMHTGPDTDPWGSDRLHVEEMIVWRKKLKMEALSVHLFAHLSCIFNPSFHFIFFLIESFSHLESQRWTEWWRCRLLGTTSWCCLGVVKQNSSISDFVARGRTDSRETSQNTSEPVAELIFKPNVSV